MTYFSFLQINWKIATCVNYRKISYDAKKKNIISVLNDMPKFQIMSESYLKGNEFSKKRRPSQYILKVLGSGAHISNSLYVFTDHVRYLFNCGEGTQRLSVEHGMKLSKVQNIFVTYQSWKNVGGLLGCALTMQSMGIKEFNLYGPPGVEEILSATQSFMNLRKINIKTRTNNPRLIVDDNVMKVEFVPLYQELPANLHKNSSDTKVAELLQHGLVNEKDSKEHRSKSKSLSPDSNKLKKTNQKDRSQSEVRSSSSKEKYALCYICKTVDFLGNLNLEACVELGVPAGPLLGRLKNRENVYLENGNLVRWEDVTKNHAKPITFIVVDCPTTQYLDALLEEPAFVSYQFDCKDPAFIVVHFTAPEVMNSMKYREWIGRFPSSTKHLRLNSDNKCLGNIATHRMQTKLNLLHPEIFPMLHDSSIPVVKDEHSGKIVKGQFTIYRHSNEEEEEVLRDKIKYENDLYQKFSERQLLCSSEDPYEYISTPNNKSDLKIIKGRTTLGIQLYPPLDYEYFHNMCLDPIAFFHEAISINDWNKELNELKNFVKELSESHQYKNAPDYPKILFLGTGSGAPYKTRNTSGILIYLDKNNLMLLDCGEGTYTQMLRLFGKEKLEKIFENLRIIYVSHPHADHHLGLITILNERKKILRKKSIKGTVNHKVNLKEHDCDTTDTALDSNNVLLLLPSPVQCWLHLYDRNYDSILQNTEILLNSLVGKSEDILRTYLDNLNITTIQTCTVQHCFQSYGVTFTHSSGCKITYSGDTMPSDKLIEFGRNSNILIHEATFEDGMEVQANQKKHSTLNQAIKVGEQMNAKFTLLTHFSQRYSHLPYLPEQLPDNVGIAFDNMLVNEKQLTILPKLMKFYKKLFADKVMELTAKQIKRCIREERRNESLDSPPRKRKAMQ